MSIRSTLSYSFILIFSFIPVFFAAPASAQTDTTTANEPVEIKIKKTDSAGHQLCVGIDLFHPLMNHFLTDRSAYEFEADYYLHNEFYAAMELGWGGSDVTYPDLKYHTSNNFIRLGFNKTVLPRDNPRDWDMMFFGLRMGLANVNRSGATFSIADSVWGNTGDSSVASKPAFAALWVELTAGMRVAIVDNLFAGWNIRGKFMMNSRSFNELPPLYIAGYGKGDKNSAFDFNVYISYAFRWKRKFGSPLVVLPPAK